MKKGRLIATVSVAAALIVGIAALPLPHYVWAVVEVSPYKAEQVFADVRGHLEKKFVNEGEWVDAGQTLALLRSPELELGIADLQGKLDEERVKYTRMRRSIFNDPRGARDLMHVSKLIETLEEQLAKKRSDYERLKIKAPEAGYVFAPPRIPERTPPDQLRKWIGTPLSDRNLGAYLEESDLICQIGQPDRFEAQIIIDQADFVYVTSAAQQRSQLKGETDLNSVRIRLDALPWKTLRSTVEEIAEIDYQYVSKSLSNQQGGQLPTVTDPETGVAKPLSTSYQARAPLSNESGVLRNGMRGQAKIFVGYQPLAVRIWRVLARTFHFQLT